MVTNKILPRRTPTKNVFFGYQYVLTNFVTLVMTLYQFNALDEIEQAEAVWSGTHIGERFDEEHNIVLYQIDNFYVEAYVHREFGILEGSTQ